MLALFPKVPKMYSVSDISTPPNTTQHPPICGTTHPQPESEILLYSQPHFQRQTLPSHSRLYRHLMLMSVEAPVIPYYVRAGTTKEQDMDG